MPDRDPNADNSAALLQRMADILGVPVEAFTRQTMATDGEEAVHLLRLWWATTDTQGRRRIMNLARQEAKRCGYNEDDA